MNDERKRLKELYNNLKADNYDLPEYGTFESDMADDNLMRQLYDNIKADNYDVPDYETFRGDMGYGSYQQPAEQPQGLPVNPATFAPVAPAAPSSGAAAVRAPFANEEAQRQYERSQFQKDMDKQMKDVQQRAEGMGERMEKMRQAVAKGNSFNTSEQRFNPATGKVETVHYTKTGEIAPTQIARDMASNEQLQKEVAANMKFDSDLEEAYAERERLDKEIERRKKEVKEKREKEYKLTPFGNVMMNNFGTQSTSVLPEEETMGDAELSMLLAARRSNNERIMTLEKERDNPNFFQTTGKRLGTAGLWDFGYGDIADMMTMLAFGRENMSGAEGEAQKTMLKNKALEQESASLYGENDTKGQRWGEITANAIPFVMEFLLTGGGFEAATKAGTKIGTKLATKAGAKGFGDFVLRNTGTLGGDIASGLLMANTTGGMKTAADIIGRYMGDSVIQDENGDYKIGHYKNGHFVEGGKSLGRSIYEGEMANVIEYFTEKLGSSVFDKAFGKFGNWLLKGGAGRVSQVLNNIKGSRWTELLQQGGIQGYPSEVLEEETSILLNALLVGDNSMSEFDAFGWFNDDPEKVKQAKRTQGDILGGMLLSIGAMQAPGVAISGANYAYNAAQYHRFKHNVDKSDRVASLSMTPEVWNEWKERIDNTTNEDMGNVIVDLAGDKNLRGYEKEAAGNYIANLMKMRGYNLRTAADAKDKIADNTENAEEKMAQQSFEQGYDADEQQRSDIAIEVAEGKEGAEEAWDGVVQRINDDADMMAAEQREESRRRQFRGEGENKGALRPVTITTKNGEQREVYLTQGELALTESGLVDPEKTKELNNVGTLTAYDPAEGREVSFAPSDIVEVGQMTTAEQQEQNIETNKQAYIQQQQDAATGRFNPQPGQQIEVPDMGTATVLATDGETVTLQMPDGTQQSMAIADIQQIADGVAMEDYRQRHPEAEQPSEPATEAKGAPETFSEGMTLTVRDDEGNEQQMEVIGRASYSAQPGSAGYREDPNGGYVALFVPGEEQPRYIREDKLREQTVDYREQEAEQPAAEVEQPTEDAAEQSTAGVAVPAGESAETAAAPAVAPEVEIYNNVKGEYPEAYRDKVENTVKIKAKRVAETKTALDKATAALTATEYGSKEEATAKQKRDKAQQAYDAAVADSEMWNAVKSLKDQELLAEREAKDAVEREERERRRAETEAARKREQEAYEAELARRKAEQEEKDRRAEAALENMAKMRDEAAAVGADFPIEDDADAMEVMNDLAPHTLEEVAAWLLSDTKGKMKIDPEEMRRHTGYSSTDMNKFPFIFKEDGVSPEKFGEHIEQIARENGVPFDEADTNAGFNALLNVLGEVGGLVDLNNYIKDARRVQAERLHSQNVARAAAVQTEDDWIAQHGGMSREEYASYINWMEDAVEQGKTEITDEEFNQIFNTDDTRTATTDEESQRGGAAESGTDGAEARQAATAADDTRRGGEYAVREEIEADFGKPLNTLAEVKTFMQSIGYKGSLSKVFTDENGKKFVKYKASGNITPSIYLGETTSYDVFQQFYIYNNVAGVDIPAAVEADLDRVQKEAKAASDAIYASERDEIKNILSEVGVPFVDVIDSERGSRIVFTDAKNDNGNYTDWMDVSDPDQVRDDIEFVREKAMRVIAQRAVADIAEQLDSGRTAKNDALIQRIADMEADAEQRLEDDTLSDDERARMQAQYDAASKWMDDNVRSQKGMPAAPTAEQKTLTKGLVFWLNGIGIKTHAAVRKGQEMLNKYREMVRALRAYHGSAADFEQFESSHIGEGMGVQRHGHGFYVITQQDRAKGYAQDIAHNKTHYLYKGEEIPLQNNALYKAAEIMTDSSIKTKRDAIEEAEYEKSRILPENESRIKLWDEIIDIIKNSNKNDFTISRESPIVYEVEIPEDNGNNYIDWTATIPKSDRKKIAEAVRAIPEERLTRERHGNNWLSGGFGQLANMIEKNAWGGMDIYDRLYDATGSTKLTSDLLSGLGYKGVRVHEWSMPDGEYTYVIFNDNDLKITDKIRFQKAADGEYEPKPTFYSNAANAVEGIKQEKATAEQWLAMLQKNGGLKAGEDKWTGLSEWLNDHKGESLTKQEVMDYIRENQIQVEEVEYYDAHAGVPAGYGNSLREEAHDLANNTLAEEFAKNLEEGMSREDAEDRAWNTVKQRMLDEYGSGVMSYFGIHLNEDGEPEVYTTGTDRAFNDFADTVWHRKNGDSENAKEANTTRMSYTTNGLDNKREIALVVPSAEPWNESDVVHFGDAGEGRAVAWVRFGETTDADGKRVLVIDEIQSKRHQEGRDKGYKKDVEKAKKEFEEAFNKQIAFTNAMKDKYGKAWYANATEDELDKFNDLNRDVTNIALVAQNDGIPDAPFDKNWHELAMKRMLRYAAENGYDKVAWTTGEQQAERYNIGNVVRGIDAIPFKAGVEEGIDYDGTQVLIYTNDETLDLDVDSNGKIVKGHEAASYEYEGKQLSDVVGKEIAKKLLTGEEVKLRGEDFRIGGEGMKGFYDQILPRFMDKYGKKWNVKTTYIELPNIGDNGLTMHSVEVTPEMKQSVLEGQPMFFRDKDGEVIGYTLNGEIYVDPRYAKPETPVHEYTHLIVHAIRANNPQVWERWKQLAHGEQDVIDFVKEKYPEYSENEDDFWEEVIANYTGREGGKRLEDEMRKQMRETPDIVEKARIATIFHKLRDLLKRFWDMTKDIFSGSTKGIDNFQSMDDVVDLTLAALANKYDPRATQKAATEARDKEYMEAVKKGDVEAEQKIVDEAAKQAGYTIHAYHGTGRADRVGNVFRPERATSGPMAFFTDNKPIAESYARGKQDTSIAYDTDYDDYKTQFRTKHKATGKDYSIYDVWGFLPFSERNKIAENAKHVRSDWDGDGKPIYDPNTTEANGGWEWQVKENRGNILRALTDQWLESGNLYNREEEYLDVLKLTGVTETLEKLGFEMPRYMNPNYREEAVYDVYLKIENPFDATTMVNDEFIEGFEEFAAEHEDEYTNERADTDMWDKNNVDADEFVERMRNDIENGKTYAWTSIPDVMTAYLKSLGYDGIKDSGGKNGGEQHTVWVPFSGEQVKRTDPVTYDDNGNVIPLSKRFNKRNADIRFQKGGEVDNGTNIPIDDLQTQRDYLLSDNYVSRLNGTEFAKSERPLVERVAEYYKDKYNGKVDRDGVGTVLLDERSVKDSIGHGIGRNKAIAFAAVPEIIKNGAIIDRQENWKGRNYGSITFAAPLEIAGEGYVGVVVANEVTMSDGSHRFYLHEVVLQKNLQSEEFKTGIDTGSKPGDVAKILQKIVSAKNNLQNADNEDGVYFRSLGPESDNVVDNAEVGTRPLSDREKVAKLEAEPKIKVYRSMQLIDGKLYPPMSAKSEGQLREPSEIGVWEEADERPDLADNNGKFTLNKGNGKSLKAAYNPYIHTSRTMLNDQFSEAQSRPNLVVVEMEVPESELTSDYKAEKAKDSVGAKQWKAGVIQGQLSGTREVFLSRWAKPVRIVPDSEVAANIAEQIDGQVAVMPSNVVTPSVRAELEKLGVQFVETDNTGRLVDGPNKGKTWASVYGKKANNALMREGDNLPFINKTYEEGLAEARAAGYTKKQFDAMVERSERNARKRFADWAEKLNLTDRITFVDTIDELEGLTDKQREQRRDKKGWYDTKNDKIVIILDNHHTQDDVLKTILHEGVAHHGLRAMFGKYFDDFLDNVYAGAEYDIRLQIAKLAKNHGWNIRTATEEYLATLAENTEFESIERSPFAEWWSKIKHFFLDMLHKLGIKGAFAEGDNIFSDNELRYILWRSYQNLVNPGRYRSFVDTANDVVMQDKLKVGNYEETSGERGAWYAPAKAAEPGIDLNEVATIEAEPEMDGFVSGLGIRMTMTDGNTYKLWVQSGEDDGMQGVTEFYGDNEDGVPDEEATARFGKLFGEDVNTIFGSRIGNLLMSPRTQRNGITINRDEIKQYAKAAEPAGVSKTLRDLKRENPDLLLLEDKGDHYEARGEDAKRMADILGVKPSSKGVVTISSDDIDNAMLRMIGGGLRVATYRNMKAAEDDVRFREGDGAMFREGDGAEDILNDRSIGLRERMTAAAARLAENNAGDVNAKNALYRAIGGNLADLRKAMGIQKEFDKSTVKRVADLAKILLQGGYLDGASRSEISRILSAVKNATGKADISGDIRKVMDIMVESQLRNAENALRDMEKVKASKVDAKGVEVQGVLDVEGQQIMKTFKDTRGWSEDEINEAMANAQERMASDDQAVADEAAAEYTGLQMALEYVQNIHASKVEERELRQELDDARHATDRSREYEDTLLEAIQQNKVERIQAYHDLMQRLGDTMRGSIEAAREFKEAEKERVREIQHNANSDMEGRPSDEHYQPKLFDKFTNNSLVQFLFSPLSTFDQMLRLFGNKSANGEGYLYNRFMRGWVDAREKEIRGVREKYAMLDAKVKLLFGREAKSMGELIRKIGSLPKMNVEFWDGGEMKEHTLTQGNLMYIYMVNKMLDGRMKLRKMGIDEKTVNSITRNLDPRLIELADWMQDEFLVNTRNEYNETHKRVFGAPMAAIENYFPLKILSNARVDKPEDLDNFELNDGISTKTGSIIKRRRNALALDIMGADALNVILDHVAQMEHWNAFAEYNRDLNTLRTYKRFRNQVKNMNTIYGSGDKLWQKFNDVAQMSAGSYRPKRANLDAAAVNFAKGVTAAKVSFRIYTALKQFLSMPAYIPDARPDLWAKNLATPWKSWNWAMENLPIFEERWKSRMAGDPRLLKSELDWKGWRNNVVQMASKIGMSPNAFVDALTVSIGAKTIYESRKARYLKEGYSEEQADRRAKQDAEVAYNETQQSSEGAFLSPMQVDRSWLSVAFTVFRNSSMAYQRQLHDALRNLKRDMKKGNREQSIEFMAKQMMREGVSEDKAREAAEGRYNRQIGKDALRVATFGFILQFFWNLGAKLPYLLFGDDDDKKKEMMDDVWAQSMFGWGEGLTGGDVFSQAGEMAVQGKGNPEYLTKEMPITSDIKDVLQEVGNGKYGEVVNDMVNLAVQIGIGMNPQSITDAVLAVMDACGDDPALAHEAMIAVMRILQVPQSQIKEMYFDEVGLSGSEVSNYTPEQLARRYAEYKVKRGYFVTPWNWNDKGLIAKEQEKADKAIKERMGKAADTEVDEEYSRYQEQYKEFDQQLKDYRSTSEYKNATPMEKAELLSDYRQDNAEGYAQYDLFKSMDATLTKWSKYYLKANADKQAQVCKKAIEDYKKQMVAVMDATNDEQREAERKKLAGIIEGFYKEYGNLMPTRTQEEKLEREMDRALNKIDDAVDDANEVLNQ